jgi:predicted DNA-binding transcriptional regulator AlpA
MAKQQRAEAAIEPGFLTMPEAVKYLGRSKKTIERHLQRQEIDTKTIAIPKRKPLRVYSEASLQALRQHNEKRNERIALAAQTRPPAPSGPRELAITLPTINAVKEVCESFKPPQPLPLWLDLEQAAAYSGLARETLLRLAQTGKVTAIKSGGWKLHRASLEAFAG